MKENAIKLAQKAKSDPELKSQLLKLVHQQNDKEIEALAQKHGCPCNRNELQQAIQNELQLTPEETAQMSGGGQPTEDVLGDPDNPSGEVTFDGHTFTD